MTYACFISRLYRLAEVQFAALGVSRGFIRTRTISVYIRRRDGTVGVINTIPVAPPPFVEFSCNDNIFSRITQWLL